MSLGIEPGDRVALVAESRPEWVVADLAIMSIGAITVPAYTTNTVEDHRHVLGNSGARAAIVSTPALAARLMPAAEQVDERARRRRDRAARPGKRLLDRPVCMGFAARRCRRAPKPSVAPASRALVARRHGLPDLHLRHRRRAERGDADPPQHHRQLPRRLSPVGAARPRRRGVSLLSAAVAFLRAHRRVDVSDLDRRRDLFRRGRRDAGRQSARSAPDDHDRGAAALRDPAPAHPPRHPARAGPQAPPVRTGRRDRPQASRSASA